METASAHILFPVMGNFNPDMGYWQTLFFGNGIFDKRLGGDIGTPSKRAQKLYIQIDT